MTFRFADPAALLFLLVIPVVLYIWKVGKDKYINVSYPVIDTLVSIPGAISRYPLWIPRFLRVTVIVLLILTAARPQSGEVREIVYSEGIDIIVALDISGSMKALDFQPLNRLEVAKNVIASFIDARKHDRIGLVLFGGEAFTACPLTLDHQLLKTFLNQAQIGMVEERTAIGKAIATSLNRLRIRRDSQRNPLFVPVQHEDTKDNKVIILATDGVNNVFTDMDPLTAARAAQALNIRIYTIGIGSEGMAPFPHPRYPGRFIQIPADLDEETLREIASITGGDYFRAENRKGLETIFSIIDTMEKTEIESYTFIRYSERFFYPLICAVILFIAECVLKNTLYRRFP
jgi:Ca-activated chloride channel homolog